MKNINSLLNTNNIKTFEDFIIQEELFTWEELCRFFVISKTNLKALLNSKGWSLNNFRENNITIILDKTKKERNNTLIEKKEKNLLFLLKIKSLKNQELL
jgi:hypothetical protein